MRMAASIGAGQWGIVGEKGAEVVAGPATVVPWASCGRHAGRGSTQMINFNVTTPDAPSFARSEAQMAALVSRRGARPAEQLMTGFNEIRFPTDVALGARGGPERRTDVVTLRSGGEERNASGPTPRANTRPATA